MTANPSPDHVRRPARGPVRLPMILQDDCSGCGRCVPACPHRCLELVWDFATLTRAVDCSGCGLCEAACPHEVISMA
jgi:Pyruvate/2-oxoacid:ferredoxin oxidoreductase delta subunit